MRQTAGDGPVYRVKYERLDSDGNSTGVTHYGPYDAVGTARAQRTRILAQARRSVTHRARFRPELPPLREPIITIQRSSTVWSDVQDGEKA